MTAMECLLSTSHASIMDEFSVSLMLPTPQPASTMNPCSANVIPPEAKLVPSNLCDFVDSEPNFWRTTRVGQPNREKCSAFQTSFRVAILLALFFGMMMIDSIGFSQELSLTLRYQKPIANHHDAYQIVEDRSVWQMKDTAIILCDFWDYHHCLNAVKRMKQFGPRLNTVLKDARKRGVTIIHAPSDCMDAYRDHAARKRVINLETIASDAPDVMNSWCSKIPGEELARFPIDQSDGGEDDDPKEHADWAMQLTKLGRNPKMPWKRQNEMIEIDSEKDYISDRGDEVWQVLQSRNIKNVILAGVHTNMCVLGRPFGLRQMKRNGMNVVLMRDMTDTMYNPKSWPFVNHYAGTELVISHIERFVCPTMTSDQFIGGKPFHFASDPRPHLAIVIGEKEYRTNETLPKFAEKHLTDFRVSIFQANPEDRNDFPNIEDIASADVLLISVRRRVLKPMQIRAFQLFEASGKPIIGIRTASHAFSLRAQEPPKGYEGWPTFDADVFGGNYTNHHGNKLSSMVSFTENSLVHPITKVFAKETSQKLTSRPFELKVFKQGGSLYKTSPLARQTEILLEGKVLGHPTEPVAWTFKRKNSGKSFYTSLGHIDDFDSEEFTTLLTNAIRWSAGLKIPSADRHAKAIGWNKVTSLSFPRSMREQLKYSVSDATLDATAVVDLRSVIKIPKIWQKDLKLTFSHNLTQKPQCWVDETKLSTTTKQGTTIISFEEANFDTDDPIWLTLRFTLTANQKVKPIECRFVSGEKSQVLNTAWRWMPVNQKNFDVSKIALPAKFGGSTDIYFELR